MGARSANKSGWLAGKRVGFAVVSCVFGIVLITVGFSASPTSNQKPTTPNANAASDGQRKKTVPAWNVALGNVVIVAPELGLSIKTTRGPGVELAKVASRIESQLQNLRELYREEGENNPTLMGGTLLQLAVGASGEVTQVKELSSRVADSEFRKAVIAQASKWRFNGILPDAATINCPLLFVREGMDITTLVQWEKSLGQLGDKPALAKGNPQPIQQGKAAETSRTAEPGSVKSIAETAGKPAPIPAARPVSNTKIYQIKHTIAIREEPNFSSAPVAKFTTGAKVAVVGKSGDWLNVQSVEGGPSGFLKKEFVIPVHLANRR